jgi:hypothetical protein
MLKKRNILKVNSFSNVNHRILKRQMICKKRRYQPSPLNFKTTKEVMPHVDKMFDLFNKSYVSISFVAISDTQKEYFKKKYTLST